MTTNRKARLFVVWLAWMIANVRDASSAEVATADAPVIMPKYSVAEDRFWEPWMSFRPRPTQWKGREVISRLIVSGVDATSPLALAGVRNGMEIWKIQGVVASGNTQEEFSRLVLEKVSLPAQTHFKITVFERSRKSQFSTYAVPIEAMIAYARKKSAPRADRRVNDNPPK